MITGASVGVALWAAAALAAPQGELGPKLLQLTDARAFDGETLAAAAGAREESLRVSCARLLGHLPGEAPVRLALRLAADPAPAVRQEALASLGRLLPWLNSTSTAARVRKTLHKGLADPDPRVRQAAAWAWAEAGEGEEALLTALTRERDTSVQAAILRRLWRTQGQNWPRAAARYASAARDELRRAALWSLARVPAAAGEGVLVAAVQDPDPQVRLLACQAAARGQLAALAPFLAPLVADPHPAVRVAAMNALAELGSAAGEVVTGKLLRAVEGRVADEDLEHPHERVAAVRLAGVLGCCRQALQQALEEGGWLGGEALLALAWHGDREVVERELASPDPWWRRWAVFALARLANGESLLAKAAADTEASVRLAAAQVAAKLPSKVAVPVLQALLADEDAAVRAQAAESLATLGAGPDGATLLQLLEQEVAKPSGDAPVSLIRLLAKGSALPPQAVALLEKLRYHPERAVARAAWEELFRLGRRRPFPFGKPSKPLSFYQEVAHFAQGTRFLEVVTLRGTFLVALDTQAAPLASYTLSRLAEEKFFDQLTFHRVVSNFVVQGGDPRGDGWGGPGYFLRDELSWQPFDKGSVGLALAGPDTGGSQFFIVLEDAHHLAGRYPRLGRVVAGMDVVERLQLGDTILRIRPASGQPAPPIPVWYGTLSVEKLEAEISEFRRNREEYQPQDSWLSYLRQAQNAYGLVVAMGTWCSDSREQVPRLLKVLDLLGRASPFRQVTLLGIDRSKKVVPAASFPYGAVEKVPTIVVTFSGAEVGRIVETPLSSSIEEDLVRILAPLEGWSLPQEGGET